MIWLNALLNHFSTHPKQFVILLAFITFSKSTIFLSSIFPPASVILLAGISVGLNILSPWLIWITISLSATAGSAFNFYIGQIITRTGTLNQFKSLHKTHFLHICKKLDKNATLALFTSRFIAILRYLVPLIAGVLHLSPRKVYCISTISAAIWSAIYVNGLRIFLLLSS